MTKVGLKQHEGNVLIALDGKVAMLSKSDAFDLAMRLLYVIDNADAHRTQSGIRTVDCRKCGNIFDTKCKPGNATTCPKCKTYRRISLTGKDD